VEYFSKIANNDRREKLVVTISRFNAEKRLDRIVDVAARLRDYTFVLIGSTYEYSSAVLHEIERKAREYRLDNVFVKTDLPRPKVLGYLRDARFYLHPPFPEHFGIAIVEAMAAGLVPIVYRDGGAWTDIVRYIDRRLGYSRVEEVPKIIKHLDADSDLYGELRSRSIRVSKMFSYENFKRSFVEKVDYVMRVKKLAL
jgi:glycosyltransferase involved in cell wall biosynthesis